MGVLYDYYAASTDDEAVEVLGWPAGPTVPPSGTAPKDAVCVKGIDPVVMLGMFEELLTGRDYDAIVENPRHGATLAGVGETGIAAISDAFTADLARTTDARIAELAGPWSRIEEFWGQADSDDLREFLMALRDLAARATEHGYRLYCWMST